MKATLSSAAGTFERAWGNSSKYNIGFFANKSRFILIYFIVIIINYKATARDEGVFSYI